jgi:hypothetical protein
MGAKLASMVTPKQWYMCDLMDGDVAVITDIDSDYTGIVVHIYGDVAVTIGCQKGTSWTGIGANTLLVRKLLPGELIEIT